MEFKCCQTIRLGTTIPGKFIDVELYYSLGGYNCFTCKQETRGYYISVRPITVERNFVTYVGFSGRKTLIHECNRKGTKAERESLRLVNTEMRDLIERLVMQIAKENNLEVLNNEG